MWRRDSPTGQAPCPGPTPRCPGTTFGGRRGGLAVWFLGMWGLARGKGSALHQSRFLYPYRPLEDFSKTPGRLC